MLGDDTAHRIVPPIEFTRPIMQPVHLHTRGREVARYLRAMASTRCDPIAAPPFALERGWTQTAAILKAAVTALDPTDMAGVLRPVTADLVEVLRPQTIIGRLPGLRPVPMRTRVLAQEVGGMGAWVSSGAAIPVSALGFDLMGQLDALKAAGIRCMSAELLMNAFEGTDAVIAADAAAGVAQVIDVAFVDPGNGGSSAKPASITHNAPSFEATGADVASIDADLAKLLASLTGANMSLATAAWVMLPKTASHLALLRGSSGALAYPGVTAKGGTLLGLPVITSNNVTVTGSPGEGAIILAEASEIAVADQGEAALDVSTEASIQLNDAPAGGAQQLVNLWTAGLVAVKASRTINWSRRQPGAVATLRSVVY